MDKVVARGDSQNMYSTSSTASNFIVEAEKIKFLVPQSGESKLSLFSSGIIIACKSKIEVCCVDLSLV